MAQSIIRGNDAVDSANIIQKDVNGNVGIGTSSPLTQLQVNSSNNSSTLKLSNASTGSLATTGLNISITNLDAKIDNKGVGYLMFYNNGSERLRITEGGNILSLSGTGALGYGTGAGGTVTQLTSKGTAVTLNKPCGFIKIGRAHV